MRTPRYGVTIRNKVDAIKLLTSKKYKCPRCKKLAVRRVSSGIWRCNNCGFEAAGDAYSFSMKEVK